MTALKPCPFCGSWGESFSAMDSEGLPASVIRCHDCDAATTYCDNVPKAATAWNRRTPTPAPSPFLAALKEDTRCPAAICLRSVSADPYSSVVLIRFLTEISTWLENDDPHFNLILAAEEWRDAGCPGIDGGES